MPSSETKKNLKQPNLPLKRIRKKEQTKPKGSRRKEIIKIREKIHKDLKNSKKKKSIKSRASSLKGGTKSTNLWRSSIRRKEREHK